MSRIPLVDPASTTGKTSELLAGVQKKLGLVPNMVKTAANAPSVLESYVAFSGALGHGKLPAKLREQIAILVAEVNECGYCLSAHTAIGKMLGLSGAELAGARSGTSEIVKTASALRFAERVLRTGGFITDDDFAKVKNAGWSDAEAAEIVANVALNIFTNLINKTFEVEIDFPVVEPGVPALA